MNDLISRQDAIDAIQAIDDHSNSDRANALGLAENAVRTLPSAEKTGEWVDSDGLTTSMMYCVYCSECGEWGEYASDYCPNCGAYMRGKT